MLPAFMVCCYYRFDGNLLIFHHKTNQKASAGEADSFVNKYKVSFEKRSPFNGIWENQGTVSRLEIYIQQINKQTNIVTW